MTNDYCAYPVVSSSAPGFRSPATVYTQHLNADQCSAQILRQANKLFFLPLVAKPLTLLAYASPFTVDLTFLVLAIAHRPILSVRWPILRNLSFIPVPPPRALRS
ncbi:hypothetical protein BDV11DRAFT_68264 [Aspergillus similis]